MNTHKKIIVSVSTLSLSLLCYFGPVHAAGGLTGLFNTIGSAVQGVSTMMSGIQQTTLGYNQQTQNLTTKLNLALNTSKQTLATCLNGAATEMKAAQDKIDQLDQENGAPKGTTGIAAGSVEASALVAQGQNLNCSNADRVLGATKATQTGLLAAAKKVACISNYQASVDAAINAAQSGFNDMIKAAGNVVTQRQDLADKFAKTSSDILDKLDGPADKDGARKGGGLVDQFNNLEGLKKGLQAAISGVAQDGKALDTFKTPDGKDTGLQIGLVSALKKLKPKVVAAGNAWYGTFSGNVWSCMGSVPIDCPEVGQDLAPNDCLAAIVRKGSRGQTGPKNDAALKAVLSRMGLYISKQTFAGTGSVEDPVKFIPSAVSQVERTADGASHVFGDAQWKGGGVDPNTLATAFNRGVRSCAETAQGNFKRDIDEAGPAYSASRQAIFDERQILFNGMMAWVDQTTNAMGAFRQAFYGSDDGALDAKAAACRATNSVDGASACLQNLSSQLSASLDGNSGLHNMPVPNLTTDASGALKQSAQNYQCSTYKNCLQVMRDVSKQYDTQVTTQKDAITAFVKTNNQSFEANLKNVASIITIANDGIMNAKLMLNQELAHMGVAGSLATRSTAKTPLTTDDKLGGISKFADGATLKGSIASVADLQELDPDSLKAVQDGIKTRGTDLDATLKLAGDMAQKCKVTPAMFASLKNTLGDCSCKGVCGNPSGSNLRNIAQSANNLYNKSQVNIDDQSSDSGSTLSSQIDSCFNARKPTLDDCTITNGFVGAPHVFTGDKAADDIKNAEIDQDNLSKANAARSDKNACQRGNDEKTAAARNSCAEEAIQNLDSLAESSRSQNGLHDSNTAIQSHLQRLAGQCSAACKASDDDTATQAQIDFGSSCRSLKADIDTASRNANSSGRTSGGFSSHNLEDTVGTGSGE